MLNRSEASSSNSSCRHAGQNRRNGSIHWGTCISLTVGQMSERCCVLFQLRLLIPEWNCMRGQRAYGLRSEQNVSRINLRLCKKILVYFLFLSSFLPSFLYFFLSFILFLLNYPDGLKLVKLYCSGFFKTPYWILGPYCLYSCWF